MKAGRAGIEPTSSVLETDILAAELPTHKRKARGFVYNPRALRPIQLNTNYGGGHLPVAVSSKLAILRSNLTRHGTSDRRYKPAADSVLDIRCHTRAFIIVLILYRKMRYCQADATAHALATGERVSDLHILTESDQSCPRMRSLPAGCSVLCSLPPGGKSCVLSSSVIDSTYKPYRSNHAEGDTKWHAPKPRNKR